MTRTSFRIACFVPIARWRRGRSALSFAGPAAAYFERRA
jgi:hypothetical protein